MMSKKKAKETREQLLARMAEGKREPSKREATAISAAKESRKSRPARAAFAEHPDSTPGNLHLDCPHSDTEGQPYLVAETFGTASDDFVTNAILQLSNVTTRKGEASIEGLNASLALVGAIAPENELEAALAAQMAATHELSMDMLRRAKAAQTRDGLRDYGNLATKLSRTFTAQMKALSDWRRGGEQVVRHVHVYEGGQAVVAENVNVGGRQNEIGAFNPHVQGALCAPVFGQDAAGHPLPVSSDEGPDALPASRREDEGGGGAQAESQRLEARSPLAGAHGSDGADPGVSERCATLSRLSRDSGLPTVTTTQDPADQRLACFTICSKT